MNNSQSTKMAVISVSKDQSSVSDGFSGDKNIPQSQNADHPKPVVPAKSPEPSPEPISSGEHDPLKKCDKEGDGDSNTRQAWKKPSNGGAIEVTPVMGVADAWPALSESTKPLPKSLKPVAEDSTSSILQGSVTSHPPSKDVSNSNFNSAVNHILPMKQIPMKRGGGSNGPGPNPPPLGSSQPPPQLKVEMHHNKFVQVVGVPPMVSGHSPWNNLEPRYMGDVSQHMYMVYDHHMQRNGSWRGNSVTYNNRHDLNRGNVTWCYPRGSSVGDVPRGPPLRPSQKPLPRDFARAAPPNVPQFSPFVGPYDHPELQQMYFYSPAFDPNNFNASAVPQPYMFYQPRANLSIYQPPANPPIYQPTVNPPPYQPTVNPPPYQPPTNPPPSLSTKIVEQIEHYFSDGNLEEDPFLRINMDNEGWVPITLIAGFNRIVALKTEIPTILRALRTSTAVEVKDGKVRKRNGWEIWPLKPSRTPSFPHAQSYGGSTSNSLPTRVQQLNLNEVTPPNGDPTSQDSTQPPSDPSPTC